MIALGRCYSVHNVLWFILCLRYACFGHAYHEPPLWYRSEVFPLGIVNVNGIAGHKAVLLTLGRAKALFLYPWKLGPEQHLQWISSHLRLLAAWKLLQMGIVSVKQLSGEKGATSCGLSWGAWAVRARGISKEFSGMCWLDVTSDRGKLSSARSAIQSDYSEKTF